MGIDLSQVQVDEGSTRAQALGLNNLQLLAGDIARTDLKALGRFDSHRPWRVQLGASGGAGSAPVYVPQVVGSGGRGLHELQRVSGLEGQGNRSRCDATCQRRQRDAGREGPRGPPHGDFLRRSRPSTVCWPESGHVQGARPGFRGFLPLARRTQGVQRTVLFLRDAGTCERAGLACLAEAHSRR